VRTHGLWKLLLLTLLSLAIWSVASLPGSAVTTPNSRCDTPGPRLSARVRPHPKAGEGFEMRRVGNHCEPVVNDIRRHEVFKLPGTDMTFATYDYIIPKELLPEPVAGFLVDHTRFYYLDDLNAPVDDPRYGLVGDYFVVQGNPPGASGAGHAHSMYLFQYGRNTVRLCDAIEDPYIGHHAFGFVSNYPGKPAYGHESTTIYRTDKTSVWLIRERDSHNNPLIRVHVYQGFLDPDLEEFYEEKGLDLDQYHAFDLWLKIVTPRGRRPRLQVALDPGIYGPAFESIKEVSKNGVRPAGYYIYGFLAGRFDLSAIEAELADIKGRGYIVDILKAAPTWDAAFHDRSGPLPNVIEYKLRRR